MKKTNQKSQIIIYKTNNGQTKIDVRFDGDTVWLTQNMISELFQKGRSTVTEHIQNIFKENELQENSVCREFRRTGTDDKEYIVKYYNLELIIAVGYRVKSTQGTAFRQWATGKLKEYIVKGFLLNEDRFKTGKSMIYFEELQEKIREIRLSERFFYQKIKDIYTTSIDYDAKNEKTLTFFKIVQNKLIWAVSKQTAAELVYNRANANLPLMGMQSFDKKLPVKITKQEIEISKNYLEEKELKLLGLIVEQYLAFAETMAKQKIPMYMKDWIDQLDTILKMNKQELLNHAGKISHVKMIKKVSKEFKKFQQRQKEVEKKDSLKELEQDYKKIMDNS